METFKVKVKETTEKEVEVSFPSFRKSIAHHYKIVSAEMCIQVSDWTSGFSISTVSPTLAYFGEGKDCTESEFIDAYNEVKNKLEDLSLKS